MKIKILVVDDYAENIQALSGLIDSDRVEILSASSASAALELVNQNEFGLALLDVQMPEIGGFELAKIIRGVKRFRSLPIIFVTAHQQESQFLFDGYRTGAVDFLFKPLDPNMVRAKVDLFVEMAQQRIQLQHQVVELEKLRLEAQSANLAKSQFLANMSHEIRTPLSAVMGFADLIARGGLTEEKMLECTTAVRRNGSLLMRLIDDILDLSKIEANRLDLEREPFNLAELLADIDATMSFRARENGVELHIRVSPFKSEQFVSDAVRLKQVLLNIIGNAIKFSPGGAVNVDVRIDRKDFVSQSRRKLVAVVKDSGIGMSAEQRGRLFLPFSQADPSTRRKYGGSGLGLIISREIARASGGELKLIESEPEKGTTFQIEFMLDVEPVAEELLAPKLRELGKPGTDKPLQGLNVLAIDDSQDNLTLIEFYLRDTGTIVTYAENGRAAIDAVKQQDFDLILMDVQMPEMDGHEATQAIRKLGFKKTILALTAHIHREEHEKCFQSGCDGILTKPISKTRLIGKLREVAFNIKG